MLARLTAAPGNGEPLGGIKVVTESGWFAARPSGTESIYKIYAESFRDESHLERIVREAEVDPEILHSAPHSRPVRRLDEVRAAKQVVVKYRFEDHPVQEGSGERQLEAQQGA